jgi:hypothetical protein
MVRQRGLTRFLSGLGTLVLVAGLTVQVFLPGRVFAAQAITQRSLTLEAGASDGGSKPGGTVKHLFNFTLDFNAVSESIGSVTFQYCTTAAAVPSGIGCYAPAGINVSGATLTQDGGGITGFTVKSKTANEDASDPNNGAMNTITIGTTSAVGISSATALAKEFSGIVNPSTTNQTFFVRISAFSSTDGTGTPSDTGTVAASTANQIQLSGNMPESLVFCTGGSINETNNVPDCSTATSGSVSFNQLFSPQSTSWATSQMAASTNATSGYAITVNGPTLTSGSNTISAINAAGGDVSRPGTSQFGMNLVLDTDANSATPAPIPASANVTSPSGGTLYNGEAVAPYSTGGSAAAAKYEFVTGNPVADSNSAGSDAQVYTATYMVNVPGHQPAGTYASTLTYICTATF